jgi:hypothetical protein
MPIVGADPRRESAAVLRGRVRRAHLDEHFARTSQLIGIGTEEDILARSRELLRRHVDDVTDEVHRRLRAYPEMAVHFSDGQGALDDPNGRVINASVEHHYEEFRQWVVTLIEDPGTHARPRT